MLITRSATWKTRYAARSSYDPYGFYITGVAGSDGEVNGFTTVGRRFLDPQQVIVAVRKDQHTHDLVETLCTELPRHGAVGAGFTEPLQHEDGLVGGSSYTTGERAPLFEEAFAHLECRVSGKEAGDHTVYLGDVVAANLRRPADILSRTLDTPTGVRRLTTLLLTARAPAQVASWHESAGPTRRGEFG